MDVQVTWGIAISQIRHATWAQLGDGQGRQGAGQSGGPEDGQIADRELTVRGRQVH